MDLYAWQHIYANVERDRSPTKTAGFQTLFYSHEGLDKNDVADIEARVFYVFGDHNPVKRVFFHLKSGKVAIGQVLPIEGRDGAGRKGLYIAHTLIFSIAEFEAANINPMNFFSADVFTPSMFSRSLDEAFSKGDAHSDNINLLTLQIPAIKPEKNIPITNGLRKLVQCAINHQKFSDSKKALAMVGSAQAIEATLASVLALIPSQFVSHCTFDTFFERGGKLNFTYCWCVGFNTLPRLPFYTLFDVDNQTFRESDRNTDDYTKISSSYGRWVDVKLKSNNLDDIIGQKQEAYIVGSYLDKLEGEAATVGSLDDNLLLSMLNANQEIAQNHIRQKMEFILPESLSAKIFEPIYASLSVRAVYETMEQGFESDHLLAQLFAVYQQAGFKSPKKEERQALAKVLQKHEHQPLQWLSLIWGGASWENPITQWRIRAGVEKMDEQAYQEFWKLAIPAQLVDPMDTLVDGKEAIFTKLITQHQLLDVEEVPKLVKLLIKAQHKKALDLLAPYVPQLDKQQFKKVKELIAGDVDIPERFTQAMKHHPAN